MQRAKGTQSIQSAAVTPCGLQDLGSIPCRANDTVSLFNGHRETEQEN
jgi:hypothetical protein